SRGSQIAMIRRAGEACRDETLSVITQNPFTRGMGTGAKQLGPPGRRTRSLSVPTRRERRRRARPPAHPCRTQVTGGVEPNEKQWHPVLPRRQAQPPRGGEIKRARIAGDLSDHAGKLSAAQGFLKRKQRV